LRKGYALDKKNKQTAVARMETIFTLALGAILGSPLFALWAVFILQHFEREELQQKQRESKKCK